MWAQALDRNWNGCNIITIASPEDETMIVEDDPRSYTHDDKQEKLYRMWCQVCDKTLRDRLMGKKTMDRRRLSDPTKLASERVRTSLKAERSTREAGDLRSKMKSARVSLNLSFCSTFLAPVVGCIIVKSVRLVIDIAFYIFSLWVFREKEPLHYCAFILVITHEI